MAYVDGDFTSAPWMEGDGITSMMNISNFTAEATILITGVVFTDGAEPNLIDHFLFRVGPRGAHF